MLLLAHFNVSKNEIRNKGVEKKVMWGICIGSVLGALLMNLAVEEENKINKKLKKVINNLESDLDDANLRVENRDNLIKDLEEIIKTEDFTFDKIEKIKELISEYQSKISSINN